MSSQEKAVSDFRSRPREVGDAPLPPEVESLHKHLAPFRIVIMGPCEQCRTKLGFRVLADAEGVFVSELTPGGLADRAGLRASDSLVGLNDEPFAVNGWTVGEIVGALSSLPFPLAINIERTNLVQARKQKAAVAPYAHAQPIPFGMGQLERLQQIVSPHLRSTALPMEQVAAPPPMQQVATYAQAQPLPFGTGQLERLQRCATPTHMISTPQATTLPVQPQHMQYASTPQQMHHTSSSQHQQVQDTLSPQHLLGREIPLSHYASQLYAGQLSRAEFDRLVLNERLHARHHQRQRPLKLP
jgi:hypothetical protein